VRILKTGLTEWDRRAATPGLTVFAPVNGTAAYLVNMKGDIVHQWRLHDPCCTLVYMLPGGRLLSTEVSEAGRAVKAGGVGGIIREYDWDGAVVWEYLDEHQHHDARRLANGNTLYLGWAPMPPEAAARVRGGIEGSEDPGGVIHGDFVREITPAGATVWEWYAHEMEIERFPLVPLSRRNEYAHANTCFPLEDGVLISFRRLCTILIVDRATRRVRWSRHDLSWGGQHDCQLLPNGNILLFANGFNTPDMPHSRVIEFDPKSGETVWEYRGAPVMTFFSPHISGAQRLDGGNTLICEGGFGRIFEVTPAAKIVWEYVSPFEAEIPRWGAANWVFRAYRYGADSPEIDGRVAAM
jgi:Arylsulfotransferase (ASST)